MISLQVTPPSSTAGYRIFVKKVLCLQDFPGTFWVEIVKTGTAGGSGTSHAANPPRGAVLAGSYRRFASVPARMIFSAKYH
jgi:hypothetical protein